MWKRWDVVVQGLRVLLLLGAGALGLPAQAQYVLVADCTGSATSTLAPGLHTSGTYRLVDYQFKVALEHCTGVAGAVEALEGATFFAQQTLPHTGCDHAAGLPGYLSSQVYWPTGESSSLNYYLAGTGAALIAEPTFRPSYVGWVTDVIPHPSLIGGAYSLSLTYPGLNVSQACATPRGFTGGAGLARVMVIRQQWVQSSDSPR